MAAMDIIQNYLVDHPRPLIGAETIQLLIIREILDYTVLRTEEDRQLNAVVTPLSIAKPDPTGGWPFWPQSKRLRNQENWNIYSGPLARMPGWISPNVI
ncbi:MAG: hypothetical protein PVG39_04460 [Desulfobacteraceae bacterium]|jgi:hypothetical protein